MDFNKLDNTNYNWESVKLNQINLECESSLLQVNNFIQAGQIQAGFELVVKILQYNPQFGKAYNYLGWIYETQYQNYIYAEEYYKQAMKYEPDYAPTYYNYGYLLLSSGRFDELKAYLDRALNIPNICKDKIYNYYALMFEMQQNLEPAMNYYFNAAMTALDTNILTYYQEGIKRCKIKLELKNSLDVAPNA